jgi:hypothetical protein
LASNDDGEARFVSSWIPRAGVTLLAAALIGAGGWLVWDRSGRPSDFSQDYFAARVLLQGGSIYDQEVADLGWERFGVLSPGNFHPPTVTVLFVPLALPPYRAAFFLLAILNAGLFILSVWLASRATSLPTNRLLLAGLLWYPFWASLTHGQVSMLIAAALTGCWICDERGKPATAGALAGLAVLLKIFPALVGLYFLIRGDRRALLSMIGVTVGGLVLSAVVVGVDDVVLYATSVAPESAARWTSHPLNVSLNGALQAVMGGSAWGTERLFDAPGAARLLAVILGVAIVAATALRGFGSLRDTELGARRLLAGICVASLLLSPLTWSHTLAIALFPLIVEAARSESMRSRFLLVVIAFVLIGFPGPLIGQLVAPIYEGAMRPWFVAATFQLPAIGLTILWWRLILGRGRGSDPLDHLDS